VHQTFTSLTTYSNYLIRFYTATAQFDHAIYVWMYHGAAGLNQFSDQRVNDPKVLRLAELISYKIDPENEYPRNYTGHIRVELRSGEFVEINQPHMRGGKHEPLTEKQITAKFVNNCMHGGWKQGEHEALLEFLMNMNSHRDMLGFARVASSTSD
jgi:2-methylcitrate dehydratase PrpD